MRRSLLLLPLLAGCIHYDDTSGETSSPSLQWYTTCGDPVCSGYHGPFAGVPLCTTEAEGVACTPSGATCDPVNDCDALLVCATSDPKSGEGGCPISLRKYKEDIQYLSPADQASMANALLDVKLATYRYKGTEPAVPERLGFLIDDQPAGSPAVLPDGGHVDVYGYTSMTVAAVQRQQAEIEALSAQVAALQAQVEQMQGSKR